MTAPLIKSARTYRRLLGALSLRDYRSKAWVECHRYRQAIEREFGRDAVRAEIERVK